MRRRYRLEDMHDDEFEELVNRICVRQLGTGIISFASGRDGGRDGKFEGTANNFPSAAAPLSGKFIIQSKWTSNPVASCSDSTFVRSIKNDEMPRIENLVQAGELDHYLLFTSRKKPAGSTISLQEDIRDLGMESAHILGVEEITRYLDLDPSIWQSMGFPEYGNPFTINPTDLTNVVAAFYATVKTVQTKYDGAKNFEIVKIKNKNKINGLSDDYDVYIREDSLPFFTSIGKFLSDPRNVSIREQYHDAADELKQKIVVHREDFETFDNVLTFVSDLMIDGNPGLKSMKRYVRTFLHYMYYDCDIGKKHAEAQ